jgi:DNA-binding NarL/FixJ family response regulator
LSPTSILIADDHALFRYGIKAMISSELGFELAGEASTGEEAVRLAAELRPDIVLMDIQMPGINGIEATRRILEDNPSIGVVVVTMFDKDDSVFAAMRAGARGYVLKGADADEVIKVVGAVANGEAYFGPDIARKLMDFFSAPKPVWQETFPELTAREREVLDLIAAGLSNTQISHRLHLSQKTVRNHVSHIFLKLQVADRTQAVIRAREAGMGRDAAVRRPDEPLR